jgi:isopropylmalate/homocitrate/citramalate synthase
MFLHRLQPKCAIRSSVFSRINPQLFDVSLRDGIQNADATTWSTDLKMSTFRHIVSKQQPHAIEIGSLVSPKVLPIMNDSLYMLSYANSHITSLRLTSEVPSSPKIYMLVPSLSKLQTAIDYGVRNVSFITSVSDKFQEKNTNRNLVETKTELVRMTSILKQYPHIRSKLYISCITECPIVGKLDLDYVLRELLLYHFSYDIDELCISDTCGTLSADEYEYLIDSLIYFGVPVSKLSLHLHVSDTNRENIRKILWYSFQKKIRKFDVSMVETGGCSVTMRPDQRLPNLSYELFYHYLERYVETYMDIYHS